MSDERDPGVLLSAAVEAMTEQVEAMNEQDWSRITPCSEWDGHRLVDHVTDTLTGILGMIEGRTYLESKYGDEGRTDTPAESLERWHRLAGQARVAAEAVDPAQELTGPMGPGPAAQAMSIPTHDLTVHAWDLAATRGVDLELPELLRADLESLVHSTPPEILRSPGLFGPEVKPPEGAGPTAELMAFLGRSRAELENQDA